MWILEINSHLIRLSVLMQDPSINSSSQQIIRSSYSMNISSQMKIELEGEQQNLFIRNHLMQFINLRQISRNHCCHLLEAAAQINHLYEQMKYYQG